MNGIMVIPMEAIFENGIAGTVLVGVILLGIITLIIRSMILDKKKGKSLQCGCDCKYCSGQCGRSEPASPKTDQ